MTRSQINVLERLSPSKSPSGPVRPASSSSASLQAASTSAKARLDEMLEGRMGRIELSLLTITFGLLLAVLLTVVDVAYRGRPGLSCRDLLLTMGLAAVVTVPSSIVVAALLVVVIGLAHWHGDRKWWSSFLTCLSLPVLTLATILWNEPEAQTRLGFLAAIACAPASALLYVILARRPWTARPIGMAIFHLTIIQGVLIGVCGTATLFAWTGLTASPVIAWIAALIVTLFFYRSFARGTPAIGASTALFIPLLIYGFAVCGSPTPSLSPLSGAPPAPLASDASESPTVVLIVLDTTRRDHLGAYGDHRNLTPHLDKIAEEGAVYEQAISPAPWTIPSHASLFTGWYPLTHGCTHEHHLWLDDSFVTLAEMLRDEGYQTVSLNSNFYLTRCNLLQGFDTSVFLEGPYDQLGVRRLSQFYGAPPDWVDKGSGEAVQFLAHWLAKEKAKGKPLFLFLNLFEGHRPYIPPRAERLAHLPPGVDPFEAARFAMTFEPIPFHIRGAQDAKAQKLAGALYEALIQYQDQRMREILNLLARRLDLDNTLLIVLADHGENLGEEGRWEHIHAINETLIHVPLIIRYPKRFPGGTRVPGLCQTLDIVPTIFDVLGKDCPTSGLPGRSLTPQQFQPRLEAFAQVSPYTLHFPMIQTTLGFENGLRGFNVHRRVLRTATMKYVWQSDGRHQLYDLTADPLETVNLVETKPDVAAQLHQRLTQWWSDQPTYKPSEKPSPPTPAPLDKHALEQLRSLGYVGG